MICGNNNINSVLHTRFQAIFCYLYLKCYVNISHLILTYFRISIALASLLYHIWISKKNESEREMMENSFFFEQTKCSIKEKKRIRIWRFAGVKEKMYDFYYRKCENSKASYSIYYLSFWAFAKFICNFYVQSKYAVAYLELSNRIKTNFLFNVDISLSMHAIQSHGNTLVISSGLE